MNYNNLVIDFKLKIPLPEGTTKTLRDLTNVQCYKCGKYGHIRKTCRSKVNFTPSQKKERNSSLSSIPPPERNQRGRSQQKEYNSGKTYRRQDSPRYRNPNKVYPPQLN